MEKVHFPVPPAAVMVRFPAGVAVVRVTKRVPTGGPCPALFAMAAEKTVVPVVTVMEPLPAAVAAEADG